MHPALASSRSWEVGRRFLRGLNRLVPLNHRLWPLLGALLPPGDHVQFPFHGSQHLVIPRAWLNPFSTALLLHGSARSNPEFAFMDRYVWPRLAQQGAATLVDVGAGIGAVAAWMRAHASSPIQAYEPSPEASAALGLTAAANGWTGVGVVRKALGAEPGRAVLDQSPNSALLPRDAGGAPAQRLIDVEVTTLDAELAGTGSRVGMIKVDVEGYEGEVLRGAARVIGRDRPLLWVEAHPRLLQRHGSSIEHLVALLESLRYTLRFAAWPPPPQTLASRLFAHYRHRGPLIVDDVRRVAVPLPEQVFVFGVPAERASS